MSIRLSSVFVRESQEVGGSEFLVYAEVYDVVGDQKKLVKVLFQDNNQAPGFLLNVRDRLMYGPVEYQGHPLRIRLFVVELDKQENEIVQRMVRTAAQVATSMVPTLAPFQGTVMSAGDLFLQLNPDDKELIADFTLYPKTMNKGPYLKTGEYVVIKTENAKRLRTNLLGEPNWGSRPEHYEDAGHTVTDMLGRPITTVVEDYTRVFNYEPSYDGEDHPLLTKIPGLFRLVRLRVMNSQLWLETVALSYKGRIIAANPSSGYKVDAKLNQEDDGFDYRWSTRSFTSGAGEQQELVFRKKQKNGLLSGGGGDTQGDDPTARPERVVLGERFPYMEKSHAIITIAEGGEAIAGDQLQKFSDDDQKALTAALQPELTAQQINAQLDAVAGRLVKLAQGRRVVRAVNSRFKKAEDRATAEFPLAYLKRLEEKVSKEAPRGDEGAFSRWQENVSRNEVIIETVASMTDGFPIDPEDARNPDAIKFLKGLKADAFQPNLVETGKKDDQGNAVKAPDGTFTYAGAAWNGSSGSQVAGEAGGLVPAPAPPAPGDSASSADRSATPAPPTSVDRAASPAVNPNRSTPAR